MTRSMRVPILAVFVTFAIFSVLLAAFDISIDSCTTP